MMDIQQKKKAAASLSVVSNTVLVIIKLAIGLAIGSISVTSEAIHSGVDLLAALIALFAVTHSHKPADKEHPFGHGKIENISGTVEALLIFVAAGWIIFESIRKLMSPGEVESIGIGFLVMALSAIVNLFVSKVLFKVSNKTESVALEADAWHLRTDVYTSAGVAAALAFMAVGRRLFPGADLRWIDPAAAIAVALLIIKAAFDLTVKSTKDLFDVSLPQDEIQWICDYLKSLKPVVCGFHKIRTRRSGAQRFVEFHLTVEAEMSVEEAHRITDEITTAINKKYKGTSVFIHIEPCNGNCSTACIEGCLLDERERKVAVLD